MKIVRAGALLLFSLGAAATALSGPARAAMVDMAAAPADEYFGPQKMSAIGIRMQVDKLGRRYHARTISDSDLLHDAKIDESALLAWAKKYPKDPWLAPTAFHLEQLDQTVQSSTARAQATNLLHYIANTFGKTKYGHLSRLRLAQGFAPLHSESVVVATPNPYASAASSGAPSSAAPVPATSATAAASSAPSVAPSPAPSSSPK